MEQAKTNDFPHLLGYHHLRLRSDINHPGQTIPEISSPCGKLETFHQFDGDKTNTVTRRQSYLPSGRIIFCNEAVVTEMSRVFD